jgi:hypothetical protein
MSNVTVDEVTTVGSVVNVKVYKYIYDEVSTWDVYQSKE